MHLNQEITEAEEPEETITLTLTRSEARRFVSAIVGTDEWMKRSYRSCSWRVVAAKKNTRLSTQNATGHKPEYMTTSAKGRDRNTTAIGSYQFVLERIA